MRRAVVLALALAIDAGAGGCARERDGAPPPVDTSPPSLLLVTLDTFRQDAAGSGGNPAARTPHLDRLARSGVQFATAVAGTPLTLPSHACMLTGLDAPEHGVRDNGSFRLDDDVPTLAEALSARGFPTGAFLGAFPLDRRFGLARGFDVYDDEVSPSAGSAFLMAQRPGADVVAAAARWWSSLPAKRSWFAWVHLFDAHTPVDASPVELRAARGDPYAADVTIADRYLGLAVREALTASSGARVLVVGDHGESRGDHGEATHGVFVYGATISIPAVVWPASAAGMTSPSRAPFRTIDVPGTAFALLGLAPPEAPGRGRYPLGSDGEVAAYMESLYARFHYGWAPLHALQAGPWKYVAAPEPELYDLRSDPGETRNVASVHPDRVEEMAARLAEVRARERTAGEMELDEDSRAALESLGYVTNRTGPDEEGDLPDPKSMIRVQRLVETAQALISAERWDEALVPLRRALSFDPRNKNVYQTLGHVYAATGRDAAAVDYYRRCLELPPHRNDRVPRFELASSYLRLGQPDAAEKELRILLEEDPGDAATWYNLGVALDAQGQSAAAVHAWERALEADPDMEAAARRVLRK